MIIQISTQILKGYISAAFCNGNMIFSVITKHLAELSYCSTFLRKKLFFGLHFLCSQKLRIDINFEDDQLLSLNHRKSLIYLRILGLQFQTAAVGKFDISSDEINFVLEESSGPGEEMKKKYEKTKDLKITEIIFKQNSLNILIQRIDRLSLQALNVSEVSFIYLCRYFNVYIPRPACIKI